MNTGYFPTAFGKVITKEAPTKVKPLVDSQVMAAVSPEMLTDSYIYVHCYFQNEWRDALVRIWKTTFLVDRHSGSKSQLIHAENISVAPLWTLIADNSTYNFLLVFSSLPKTCKQFDLVEEIPQPGGFHITNIQRNHLDVYHVEL
ncbi:MAG: hypothetical protein ABIS36_17530 [Chryseolinea sp.]